MVEIKTKNPEKVIQGRKNKQAGALWERKVRADLEKNWIVCKWHNNVELPKRKLNSEEDFEEYPISELSGKLIPAKRKYNPFKRAYSIGTGFPDFIAYKMNNWFEGEPRIEYEVIGVEAKSNGYLDKQEREKCKWLLENKIFSKILIAKKKKEGRKVVVEYIDFQTKYE